MSAAKLSTLQSVLLDYLADGATLHYSFRSGWYLIGVPGRSYPLGVLTNTARSCLQRVLVTRAVGGGYTLTDPSRRTSKSVPIAVE